MEIPPEKAKAREAHARAMLLTGLLTLASGFSAAYLVFGKGGSLPPLMLGRWRAAPRRPPLVKPLREPLVRWRAWGPELFREARRDRRLILLSLCSAHSSSCRAMDETYADPAAARFVEEGFLPVRVDPEERPDLALRYSQGRPMTAILLPTGEALSTGDLAAPAFFVPWARVIAEALRRRDAAEGLRERLAEKPVRKEVRAIDPRQRLLAEWDEKSQGFRSSFPRWRRIRRLLSIPRPWAQDLAARSAKGALSLEDRVWGGFYHATEGPGQPEYGKRLEDQAEAILVCAVLDPEAARRTWAYVERTLAHPAGGFNAGQAGELLRQGRVVEGGLYFSLPESKRLALGLPAPDRRIFAGANARLVLAVLSAGKALPKGARAQALRTLERLWQEGVRDGMVRHGLGRGGISGFLEDQSALAEAFAAAYEVMRERRHLERALALARGAEKLRDQRTGALWDRPSLGELPEGLDRILSPERNAEALLLYRRLARLLPQGDPLRPSLEARAQEIMAWLSPRSQDLDPALWALVLAEML